MNIHQHQSIKTLSRLLICIGVFNFNTVTVYAQTGLHKWVDAQGRITYSDTPPAPSNNVKDLTDSLNALGAGLAQSEPLDYETQQIVNQHPIVIYTSKKCGPCDQGRNFLASKKYPFTEKTVNHANDLKLFSEQFNTQTLPMLAVGNQTINGFGTSQWQTLINSAGYNDNTVVPKTYRNGITNSLAPSTEIKKETVTDTTFDSNTSDNADSKEETIIIKRRKTPKTPPVSAPIDESIIRF